MIWERSRERGFFEVKEIRICSPAKINHFLYVLGKRPDGYHDIHTRMQLVDFTDEIRLQRRASGISLEVSGRVTDIPTGEENLAHRAAKLIFQEAGIEGGLAIALHKSIPAGGGLGGGSSNAAATLWGIKELFAMSLSREDLRDLALSLGSDVPFFLTSGCAEGRGRGEVLAELKLPVKPVVIVWPGFAVSSKWAYGKLKLTGATGGSKLSEFGKAPKAPCDLGCCGLSANHLEEVVAEEYPVIRELKVSLLRLGAQEALMSGSGSSVYGIFDEMAGARETAKQMRALGYLVHEGRTLGSNPIFSTTCQ